MHQISLGGLLWLIVTLVSLVFLQRILHREIQAFLLILTRHPNATLTIFGVIFLPGVFLHEFSHFIAAKLLGVRTGRFSILPKSMGSGRLRLGYVETVSGGPIRDALIGLAPLVTGCLFISFTAISQFHLRNSDYLFYNGNLVSFIKNIQEIWEVRDFWLWFYLTFAVSSTMMPSASDRHSWLPVGILLGGISIVFILVGAGSWMVEHLAPYMNSFMSALVLVFGLSAFVHMLLIIPFFILHSFFSKLTGLDVG